MTQLSLFETSQQVSITDEFIAVNFRGRWEIYERPELSADGLKFGGGWTFERFSHFATPGESLVLYRRKGG